MGAFSWFRDKNTKKNKQETPTVESHYIKLARRASFMRYAVLLFIVLFGVYSFSFHSSEITVDNFDYMMKFLNVNEDEQANKGYETDTPFFAHLHGFTCCCLSR